MEDDEGVSLARSSTSTSVGSDGTSEAGLNPAMSEIENTLSKKQKMEDLSCAME